MPFAIKTDAVADDDSVAERLKSWWKRQTPGRQDRFAIIAPLLAVILFIAAIVSAFLYLRAEEITREREALNRDIDYTHQILRLRLLEQQEQFGQFAKDIAADATQRQTFILRADNLLSNHPEVQNLFWLGEKGLVRWVYQGLSRTSDPLQEGKPPANAELGKEFEQASALSVPFYALSRAGPGGTSLLRMHVPSFSKGRLKGDLVVEYNLEELYRNAIPWEINAKYAMSLSDVSGNLLAGNVISEKKINRNVMPWADPVNASEMAITPFSTGMVLRAQAYRTSLGVIGNTLFWMVMALSAVTAWLLLSSWRHTRRRVQAQDALYRETAFRRAMEESMLTGMRAMDMNGRITYVNKAFCQMTGWTEKDLIGTTAPFPYWPQEDMESLQGRWQDEISGTVHPGGVQFRLKRKDGVLIDARMYVSPLVDAMGKQTGWMSSMTDITEPNRVRMQLAAAHERFTTVLEALDASISVAPIDGDELLFTNRLYRLWFGTKAYGHLQLIADSGAKQSNPPANDQPEAIDHYAGLPTEELTSKDIESAEVYMTNLGRWLEIRTRYLSWVDGRVAQMVIATDITARRMAEEQSELEAERAQSASRLITMGEMASSVAHELNQPLTAINNYCNGMLSRLRGQQIDTESLLQALEKTAHQAQRAGQIIQRIRLFVKRSEPNRTRANVNSLVNEALELAGIEVRRRGVRFQQAIEPGLPDLMVDPILIEQVLLNLIKNAAESIDIARRPPNQRLVTLSVQRTLVEDRPAVQFLVQDSGPGIATEVMPRLYETFFSTKTEGMGIGLSLCRSIVESHTGRLKAENIYNGGLITGCIFSFWLPAMTTVAPAASPSGQDSAIQVSP